MSTRCNIKVVYQEQSILLYHHWDGYFEGIGFDLAQRILKHQTARLGTSTFIFDLLQDKQYELVKTLNADIDYYYIVDLESNTIIGYRVANYGVKMKKYSRKDIIKLYTKYLCDEMRRLDASH